MDKFESRDSTAWECKCHVVFIPKCRRKALYGELRKHLGAVFRKLASQKESRVVGQHFWARGYFVSTVGRDKAVIREYIKNQEKEDNRLDQLGLWK